jgi:hypothetical protein
MLGYNPIQQILSSSPGLTATLSHAQFVRLTGRSFFPRLITTPFGDGIHYAFTFAIICSIVAAVASLLRGKRPVAGHRSAIEAAESGLAEEAVVTAPSVPSAGS